MTSSHYRGRFAPSPSGPLHFGSLVAALGSFLESRRQGGKWLLRMEDLDTPRCSKNAADEILRTLEAFGFIWDEPVVWQSQRQEAYATALEQLKRGGSVFGCACTRRELADSSLTADGAARYPGTCRDGLPPGKAARAWRFKVGGARIAFTDGIQGRIDCTLDTEVGDFVLLRADGIYAYQLAVVIDDAAAGITHVVRGADLLASTPRQIVLQQALGLPTPAYAHLPVALDVRGEKLSKQTLAAALDGSAAVPMLVAALAFLGQKPPPWLEQVTLNELWTWATEQWSPGQVPRANSLRCPTIPAGNG